MTKHFVAAAAASCLFGCASTQLNNNTLDLASTVADLQTKQVLFNLSQFIDDPYAIPAHVDLSSGATSTNNSVTPSIGTPLDTATGVISTVTKTLSAAPSTSASIQSSTSTAATSLSVGTSDAWSQSWSYVPIIDSDELRRLRSLYSYALGYLNDRRLIQEYPLVRKQQQIAYASVAGTATSIYCPNIGFNKARTPRSPS